MRFPACKRQSRLERVTQPQSQPSEAVLGVALSVKEFKCFHRFLLLKQNCSPLLQFVSCITSKYQLPYTETPGVTVCGFLHKAFSFCSTHLATLNLKNQKFCIVTTELGFRFASYTVCYSTGKVCFIRASEHSQL